MNYSKDSQWIAGIHSVGVALEMAEQKSRLGQQDKFILSLYVDSQRKNKRIDDLVKFARKIGDSAPQAKAVKVEYRDSGQIDRLCGTDHHQGVCACINSPAVIDDGQFWLLYDQVQESKKLAQDHSAPLLLVLDQVQDVHNLGACLRSVNAAGAMAVVVPKNNSASYSAQVAKAASGATLQTPIVEVSNLANFLRTLQDKGFWLVGFSDDASDDYWQLDYSAPTALIMGGEHAGMRKLTRDLCDYLVRIPMQGCVGSLNVSVAAGVALYGVTCARARAGS